MSKPDSSSSNLVVITGAPGSGKTPIVRELVASGFSGVAEPAREVIAEQRANGVEQIYDADPEGFLQLMLSRAVTDFERMSTTAGLVFFDRGIPDLIGYAGLSDLDASDAIRAATEHRYNEVVFALPSWREIYTTDIDRRMTFEDADAFGERVRSIYVGLGYSVVDVPRNTVTARARFILDTLGLVDDGTLTGAYEFRPVSTAADWEWYHTIRERVLWEARGRLGSYDRNHPDDSAGANHPFLLFVDGTPAGVIRVDVRPRVGWFRLVAVREDLQRRGHGRALLEFAMTFAREEGCLEVRLNSDPEAVSFYRRHGFELSGEDVSPSVGMRRTL